MDKLPTYRIVFHVTPGPLPQISNAKEDLPEPERPVITVNLSRGKSRLMFLDWVRFPVFEFLSYFYIGSRVIIIGVWLCRGITCQSLAAPIERQAVAALSS